MASIFRIRFSSSNDASIHGDSIGNAEPPNKILHKLPSAKYKVFENYNSPMNQKLEQVKGEDHIVRLCVNHSVWYVAS